MAGLRRRLVRDLAAATATAFVRRCGGTAAIAAYWQVLTQRRLLAPPPAVFATPLRAAAFFAAFRRPATDGAATIPPTSGAFLQGPSQARLPPLPETPRATQTLSAGSLGASALFDVWGEWRRRARCALWACAWGSAVCAVGEEALALVSTQGHAHGALLRILDAVAQKTHRPDAGAATAASMVAAAAAAAAAAAVTSTVATDDATAAGEAEAFDAHAASPAAGFLAAQSEFTDSEDESDGGGDSSGMPPSFPSPGVEA